MEKITLKPAVKEILYKSGEPGVYFDVLSCHGANVQEKNLGSLFVLSHLTHIDDDLSYMVSLLSSLAKREYYSPQSLAEQNSKAAFERALKKLNEILEEFFKNKKFSLNLGLAAIVGENIFISRLGKLKVALARNNEYIDILSNIQLFNKDAGGEQQFSNIISGRLFPGDKIFAYFPIRAVASRERLLNPLFVKQNQEQFSEKIAHLAANASNFACCGVHINMERIKEIPVVPVPDIARALSPPGPEIARPGAEIARPGAEVAPVFDTPSRKSRPDNIGGEEGSTSGKPGTGATNVMPAEVSMAKRANVFAILAGKLNKLSPLKNFGRLTLSPRASGVKGILGEGGRLRPRITVAALVVAAAIGWALFGAPDSGQDKAAYTNAAENFKLARSQFAQNDAKEARRLLQAALGQIARLDGKKIDTLKTDIGKTLDSIDRVSDKQPQLVYNNSGQNLTLKKITIQNGLPAAIDANNKFFSITSGGASPVRDREGSQRASVSNGASELGQFKVAPKIVFGIDGYVVVFNGQDSLAVYDSRNKKIGLYSLTPATDAGDGAIYENNLYTLSANTIYKYLDAVTGSAKGNVWGSDNTSGNLIAIAADGNIFALTQEGKLIKYFRGKKESEADLQLTPNAGSRIFTDKNSAFVLLVSPASKRVYVFDKANGEFKTTYKFDVAGDIRDFYVSPDGVIMALSAEGNIWQIKP